MDEYLIQMIEYHRGRKRETATVTMKVNGDLTAAKKKAREFLADAKATHEKRDKAHAGFGALFVPRRAEISLLTPVENILADETQPPKKTA